MPGVDINGWAIIVAALINMVLGSIWYRPTVFGKAWEKATRAKMSGNNTSFVVTAVAALVQSWILVHFVRYAGAITAIRGAEVGFWLWLGFVAIVMLTTVLFEGRSWVIWKINAGYWLVLLVINSALLAAWR